MKFLASSSLNIIVGYESFKIFLNTDGVREMGDYP